MYNVYVTIHHTLCFSFLFWVFFLSIPHQDDRVVHASLLSIPFELSPIPHILITDVMLFAIAYFCTFAAIHLNGYVGILDCDNMHEIFVSNRKGGEIRTHLDHVIYEMDRADPDRELDCSEETLEKEEPEQPSTKTINIYANDQNEFLELR